MSKEDKKSNSDHEKEPFFSASPNQPTASYLGPGGLKPGAEIGPYWLIDTLGEGGFGIVYLAEQRRLIKRRVALKVLKPGMDSKQVLARFALVKHR